MEWIARKGTVWGLLKENVFSEKPQRLDYLKELITEHFDVFFSHHKYANKFANRY